MDRQIPGFYYDEEEKKYFKIQPNHAVPLGSAYSVDGVKRRKFELEAATEAARSTERRRDHIRRARVLQEPLLGGSLWREHGHGRFVDGAVRTYVQGWDAAEILQPEGRPAPGDLHSTQPRDLSPVQGPGYNPLRNHGNRELLGWSSSTVTMGAFDFDPVTRSLFYPEGGQTLCEVVQSKRGLQKSEPYLPVFKRENGVVLSINHSPITTINIDPKTRLMLTTWREPHFGHNIHVVKFTEWDGLGSAAWYGNGPIIVSRIEPRAGVSPVLWSAAYGAQGSPFVFAIAAESGVATIDQHISLYTWMRPPIATSERRSAIVAVGCLAQHPSVVLGGARNGKVMFLDVRLGTGQNQSGNETIKHPSTVSRIMQLEDNVIVVAGLNSTLCNYDLRFIQQRPRDKAWPNRNWTRRPGAEVLQTEVSNPILVYPEHSNGPYMDLGFDIDPEAGIVAAVQDDCFYTPKIFSSKTGQVLRSLDTAFTEPIPDMAAVKALKFVQDRGSGHMKSLWVAKGTKIVRYAW